MNRNFVQYLWYLGSKQKGNFSKVNVPSFIILLYIYSFIQYGITRLKNWLSNMIPMNLSGLTFLTVLLFSYFFLVSFF